ncbi:Argininosuccinate synthase [Candidatus Vidania fulgoroideae]|nr:Argininosuccinate synthase [Candidatus Vidania fulgoroideae]
MKIIKKIRRGMKIGLAYSGGLDTSVSIKWLTKNGAKVFAYYSDLGGSNLKEIKKIKRRAIKLGAVKFKCVDCKKQIVEEAIKAIKSNAFNFRTGNYEYYNTTPIGRSVTGILLSKKMKEDGINIWCDGSTFKGNDIERFLRYSYIINKKIRFYKQWLDKRFLNILGGRKEMYVYISKKEKKEKFNYSVDSNILGNTYEGGEIENLNFSTDKIDFILCKGKKNPATIEISFTFKRGNIVKVNKKKTNNLKLFRYLNKKSKRLFIGISDQIEERIIGVKSRGIYESPAMYILKNVFDRALSCMYEKNVIDLRRENGLKVGNLLYEGKWFDCLSELIKETSVRMFKKISGEIKIKIVKNVIFFTKTKIKNSVYFKKIISMEKTKKNIINYKDRIGQLNISKISINRKRILKTKGFKKLIKTR